MADPLTRSHWDAAEEVDQIFERIGAVYVPAQKPRIVGTLSPLIK